MNKIRKKFIKYVTLNILGMLGLSCYILADTFFVANGIGADGLAALNLSIPVYSIVNGISLLLGMGGATRAAILMGQGKAEDAKKVFSQILNLAAICAAIFVIVGLTGSSHIVRLLGANSDTYRNSLTYVKWILLFAPMFLGNSIINCFVRNDKNPKLAMFAMLIGSGANIVLDYIFIYTLKMGMLGAVIATGMAPIIGLFVLSLHFIKGKSNLSYIKHKIVLSEIASGVKLGLAPLIAEWSSGIVIIVFNILILKVNGNMGVAAYGVIANIALVVLAVFTGISQGIQPIISESFGRGKKKEVNIIYRYAFILAIVFATVIYVISVCQAGNIVGIFNKFGNQKLQEIAEYGIKLYFTGFVFAGINIITATYFSSIGKAKPSFNIAILRGVIIIIPVAITFSALFQMMGIWIAFPITEFLVFVYAILMKKISTKDTIMIQ